MASDLRVKVRLVADTKNAEKNIGTATRSFGSLFSKVAGFTAVGAAFGVAIGKVVEKINGWIEVANTQEDAISALNAQLSKFGPVSDVVTAALVEQAGALQAVTRFGDEVTIAAQAQLAVFAKSGDGIKALTVATQDFATAQGIDLVSAAKLIGKTLGSSTNALIRYGIEVEGAAGSTARLESLTNGIAALYAGRAREAALTYAGALERVANAQGDLEESIGLSITSSEDLVFAQNNLAFGLEKLNAELDTTPGLIARINTGWVNLKAVSVAALIAFNNLGKSQKQVSVDADAVADAMQREAAAMESAEQKAARLKSEAISLTQAQESLAIAAAKVTAALGETTSRDLSNQIFDIVVGLKAQEEILGKNSDEFVRLEQVGRDRIELLKARVESLRDGLGDLAKSTDGVGDGMDQLGASFGRSSDRAEDFGSNVGRLSEEILAANESAGLYGEAERALANETDNLTNSFDAAARSAAQLNSATGGRLTARDSRSQGDIDAALAAGRTPFMGGTRIRTLDGGSRLLR